MYLFVNNHNSLKDSTSKMKINKFADMDINEIPFMRNMPQVEVNNEFEHPILSVPADTDWRT